VTFANLKREYEARLYLWAKSEWEREIAESFPNLRLFKAGSPWETYQFLTQLKRSERLVLARAFLERRFPTSADEALGETCSMEGVSLRSRRDDFFRIKGLYRHLQRLEKEREFTQARTLFQMMRPDAVKITSGDFDNDEELRSRLETLFGSMPSSFEEEMGAKELAGEKIQLANKRALKKAIKAKYMCAFGDQSAEPIETFAGEPDLLFKTRCCGWMINTYFFFNSREGSIEYYHDIQSEDTFEQPGQKGMCRAFLVLEYKLSFCSWMGVDGETKWKYVTESEVESVCEGVIKFCRHFFEVAPKLLKGIGLESITTE
jgi:hypothetical protein